MDFNNDFNKVEDSNIESSTEKNIINNGIQKDNVSNKNSGFNIYRIIAIILFISIICAIIYFVRFIFKRNENIDKAEENQIQIIDPNESNGNNSSKPSSAESALEESLLNQSGGEDTPYEYENDNSNSSNEDSNGYQPLKQNSDTSFNESASSDAASSASGATSDTAGAAMNDDRR